jgi:hypothetical protein
MVGALSWCLGLAQATSADSSQAQDQPEKAVSKNSSSDKQSQDQPTTSSQAATTSSAQATTTVTATIKTAGSPYKSRIKWLQPSLQGTSGLFDVFSAEGFRKGEFSLQFGGTNYDRSPGDLDITDFPVTFTLGLADRLEWSLGWIAQRRVDADNIRSFQTSPLGPVRPTRINISPSFPVAYYNGTPFLDNRFGEGISDVFSSMKLNLMSEHRDQPFGLALLGNVKVPTSRHQESLTAGRTTGQVDGGVALLASKYAGSATLMFNTGVQFIGDPRTVELQNEFRYGAGIAIGTHPIQWIFEATGTVWFGDKTSDLANPRSPVDLVAGVRWLPVKPLSIGAGYRYNARTWPGELFGAREEDHSGWLVTVAFNRKVNRPPTVECTIDTATIQQRGRATIRARANDPDDSELSITWRTTGGRLVGTGDTVTFETGDLTETPPGRYTVTAEVSDGTNTATCSVDVTVEKLKLAPTVSCEPSTQTIRAGETATIRATASDPNPGDTEKLTYSWEVDGEKQAETGSTFTFGATGRSPGRHTVKVTVTDPDGLTASCEVTVEISAPPPPAEVHCDGVDLDKTQVNAGESIRATVRARGEGLSYQWSLDGNVLSGKTDSSITIDTTGLGAGSHTVSARVTGASGITASEDCRASFTVGTKVEGYELVWNTDKARLDEVATRLESDPSLIAVIIGHDKGKTPQLAERNGLRLAQRAKRFIVVDRKHKGLQSRIEVRGGDARTPRTLTIEVRPK